MEENMIVLNIDSDKCKGCEICITVCPKKLLAISEEVNSGGLHFVEIQNAKDCIGCKSCAIICPDSVFSIFKK
jgi:2-oxoglutarate ferredoxin oxidoreductase subunit delta